MSLARWEQWDVPCLWLTVKGQQAREQGPVTSEKFFSTFQIPQSLSVIS